MKLPETCLLSRVLVDNETLYRYPGENRSIELVIKSFVAFLSGIV